MTDFGTRLKIARKDKKMTQKQLAGLLGVEQSTISNYEKNFRFPVASALADLADQLEVSVDYLLGRSDFQESYSTPEASSEVSGSLLSETEKKDTELPSELASSLKALQVSFFEQLRQGLFQEATDLIITHMNPEINLITMNEHVFEPTLKIVGDHWETGELSVADEHMISSVIDKLMTRLEQADQNSKSPNKPYSAALMLPGAEEHEFPLKMTAEVLIQHGWTTYYFGKSVPVSSLEEFFMKKKVDLLVLSVSLKPHLNSCEALIRAVKALDTELHPKIMVGGSAIDDASVAFNQLGADYYFPSMHSLDTAMDDLEKSIME
ncbi:helix-turn-helix domain-containing protein [Acidaminobacter sp.]|uniref:helix-turn-helix domain-containing protein n=1 Tax=Acidaminobacter sp. TaxID=1872102 RepID=UPI001381280D|nr:helix-turn-helix domain-containing protein [Acidaminobacter sp.]MDK9711784.1 helix-turn-helix domain-containing protein [Acidaminobacter sp.]MZQ97296.1 helix-turn-helix domain-containing protein [Acidaminobacter sp.]